MPVYVDVLLVVNSFVNYLMLLCVMKFLKIQTGRIRVLLAAAVGGLFSLKIFLPELNPVLDFIKWNLN